MASLAVLGARFRADRADVQHLGERDMERTKNDVWVGLFVLIGAAALVFLALQAANLLTLSFQPTYRVSARFDNIGGLKPQAAVKSAGVVVGRVESIAFDDKTFQARVDLAMDKRLPVPKDSSLKILTSGLLGEQYVGVEAGATTSPRRRRYHHHHAIRRGAGKPDRPVPVQQGGGRPHSRTPPRNETQLPLCAPRRPGLAAGLLSLGGCATVPTNPRDPWEPMNRRRIAVQRRRRRRAAASRSPRSTSEPCRRWCAPACPTSSATSATSGRSSTALLQFKLQDAADNFARVQTQHLSRLFGIFDVASDLNIDRHSEDFGQTLGRWGVAAGPTWCCPARPLDAARHAGAADRPQADLVRYVDPVAPARRVRAARGAPARPTCCAASNVLDEAALDKYSFTRDAYLQRRRAEIYDRDDPRRDVPPAARASQPAGRRRRARPRRADNRTRPAR
jgi:phospholipid/cholesterol/gamma-HCH transport system substrate-binding protein